MKRKRQVAQHQAQHPQRPRVRQSLEVQEWSQDQLLKIKR
jgi:hypothetical protein